MRGAEHRALAVAEEIEIRDARVLHEQRRGVERVARVFVVHGKIRTQAIFGVGVGVFIVADAGHAQAGKTVGDIPEGRAGIGAFIHIRRARAMHHHHRRKGPSPSGSVKIPFVASSSPARSSIASSM